MKNHIAPFGKKNDSSATVVDGKLILSFPEALNPIVWQMDLNEANSSALEVLGNGKGGEYKLTLKTRKGESVDIAPFENREQAVGALKMIAKALENAHGQIRPANANAANDTYTRHGTARKRRWIPITLSLIGLFALFNIWIAVIDYTRSGPYDTAQASGPAGTSSNADEPGVPVSADEFLRGR